MAILILDDLDDLKCLFMTLKTIATKTDLNGQNGPTFFEFDPNGSKIIVFDFFKISRDKEPNEPTISNARKTMQSATSVP